MKEVVELYKDLITRDDPFGHIDDFTRGVLVRYLVSIGESIPPELEDRFVKDVEDEAWQKSET